MQTLSGLLCFFLQVFGGLQLAEFLTSSQGRDSLSIPNCWGALILLLDDSTFLSIVLQVLSELLVAAILHASELEFVVALTFDWLDIAFEHGEVLSMLPSSLLTDKGAICYVCVRGFLFLTIYTKTIEIITANHI